jgi:hypothetical protein
LDVPSINNLKANMAVTGVGISQGTYITSISSENNKIYLSRPTISAGGGSQLPVTVSTRAEIIGDGIGASAEIVLSNTGINHINITYFGRNYTYADVRIYGTGTGAAARAIIPPKYGHGISPAVELSAKNINITKIFGDIDSTEGGYIPVDIKFRQYGLLVNPKKYGSSNILPTNDVSVVSQTMNVTLEGGAAYSKGEYVYQGQASDPTFYGYVLSQDYYTVNIVNFYGTPNIGTLLTNGSNARPITNFTTPEFEKYSGDILYVKNMLPVNRTLNQSEEIRIIIGI